MWYTILHSEEHQWSAKFKIVFGIVILVAKQFHYILVERIIEASSRAYRKPCITSLHLSLHTSCLGLFSECFTLSCILHFEKYALLHQLLYGTVVFHICKGMEKKQNMKSLV